MTWVHWGIDWLRHLDTHLDALAQGNPLGVYAVLMAIIFCETGLVIWPFLPGDSLLFAVGAIAARGSISLPLAMGLMCLAANCGDLLNYTIGRRLGPALFRRQDSWMLNARHLAEGQAFYDKHGRKTIILARFVPIVRTFAPLVAGIGRMPLSRFISFSIAGGILWVVSLTSCGFLLGNIPFFKAHFEMVVIAIVLVSLVPVVVQGIASRRQTRGFEVEVGR